MRATGFLGGLVVALAVALTMPACAGEGSSGPGTVEVTMTGTALGVEPASVPSGPIAFTVHNHWHHELHEMFVARTDLSAAELPLTADGTAVDRAALEVLGEVEDVAAEAEAEFSVQAAPGHYVVVCNLEAHGDAWLAAEFEVTP